jgi:hypothetical protein
MSGSTGWWRTEDVMEFDEDLLDPDVIQLAITYAYGDGTLDVSVYRNGELLGSYSKGSLPYWAAGENFVAVFGPRSYQNENPGAGAIDALVDEARIYNTALSLAQIKELEVVPPAPATPALSIVNNGDGTVTVTFEGTLQAAPTVNGPWSDVDAPSPLTIPASEAMQYARSKK